MKTTPDHSHAYSRRAFTRMMGVLLISAGSARADTVIKLQVTAKNSNDDPKGAKKPQEIQKRWLEIAATAFHLEKPATVRLEWAFYGDSLDAHNVVKHGQGTEAVELAQSKKADAKTKAVTFNFTPRHEERTGSGRRARVKTVEATGVRYHGWGVRAYVGEKLVGEAYSSADIQKRMNVG